VSREDVDAEPGEPHFAHVMAGAPIVRHAHDFSSLIDDRQVTPGLSERRVGA
jgi:hypothetical protein